MRIGRNGRSVNALRHVNRVVLERRFFWNLKKRGWEKKERLEGGSPGQLDGGTRVRETPASPGDPFRLAETMGVSSVKENGETSGAGRDGEKIAREGDDKSRRRTEASRAPRKRRMPDYRAVNDDDNNRDQQEKKARRKGIGSHKKCTPQMSR